MPIRKHLISLCLLLLPVTLFAKETVVNVYAWGGELPNDVIQSFEKETGIKVNLSTFENNETMYAKLRTSQNAGYDVIMPTSGFVDRMRSQHMLAKLDKSQLPNLKNVDPALVNPPFDPHSEYSVPLLWGTTGIFVNDTYYAPKTVQEWSALWDKRFSNKLMLLDDMREVFSIALFALGYSSNDSNPEHIEAAYRKLKDIMPNVKVFSSDMSTSVMIDEDVTVGMAWNGDTYKAWKENPHIQFIYPKEGYAIWVDNLSILANAPHKQAAHAFLNFLLKPESALRISELANYPTANLAARNQLPKAIRDNPTIYPSRDVLKRGEYVTDLSSETLALYEKYWEQLKMTS